ncbi:unnamed protein product [Trichobilharzia regenti]|nr:unnamed protein product [Trichobilharzia regenti]
MSKGETGELELSNTADFDAENGDTPVMHCKPISMPASASNDKQSSRGMIIGYQCRFRILPHLIGLAIGHRGATIQEARAIPGVRVVDLLYDGIVHVEAETIDACHSVRNLLDFTEVEIPVQPRLASRLIGSKGMNIRKLAEAAGVRRAELLDPVTRKRRHMAQRRNQLATLVEKNQTSSVTDDKANEETSNGEGMNNGNDKVTVNLDVCLEGNKDSDEVVDLPPAFSLVGTRSSVAKMRLLLEFQADNWNELDELEIKLVDTCLKTTANNTSLLEDNVFYIFIIFSRNRPMGRGGRLPDNSIPDQSTDNTEMSRPPNSRGQRPRGRSTHQFDVPNGSVRNRPHPNNDVQDSYSNGILNY